ncbi:hypothetical protein I4F81_001676 [Pyropia yezoensis]|uniref:Uncharacterized protein n=1 Tax=Pyropia yezoensis TaxID=2788 RepID=A0ACC3BN96_PYRYE|nr:hypothetical protein I4F81_001676 [Neopyropia yezoensis]
MGDLQRFCDALVAAAVRRDGTTLAALLSMEATATARASADYLSRGGPSSHSLSSNLAAASAGGGGGGGGGAGGPPYGRLPPPWQAGLAGLVEHRLLASAALAARAWQDVFVHLAAALSAFQAMVRADGRWVVAALLRLSTDVRVVAKQADGFTLAINDRGEVGDTKKWAALGLVNQLFRCYFSLNQLRLCRNLIRAVEAASFLPFEGFPAPHRVTYKYFTGRLSLYEEQYGAAAESLAYALNRLPAPPPPSAPPAADRYAGHRRAVLLYLVPARLLLGVAPSAALLDRYDLTDTYGGIVRGVTTGDLGAYATALARHEGLFMRRALFLVLDKLRTLVYRSLLRAVQVVLDGKTRLRVVMWAAAMSSAGGKDASAVGGEVDLVEAECVAANLIALGLVKGYIAHKAGYIVLSNNLAFPPVAAVMERRRLAAGGGG